jgi:hypothetical protein
MLLAIITWFRLAESKQPKGRVARSVGRISLVHLQFAPILLVTAADITQKSLGGTGPMLPRWKTE